MGLLDQALVGQAAESTFQRQKIASLATHVNVGKTVGMDRHSALCRDPQAAGIRWPVAREQRGGVWSRSVGPRDVTVRWAMR